MRGSCEILPVPSLYRAFTDALIMWGSVFVSVVAGTKKPGSVKFPIHD